MHRLHVLCFILLFCLFPTAHATQQFEGFIVKQDEQVLISLRQSPELLPVKAYKSIDFSTLKRLETGDYLVGSGNIVDHVLYLDVLQFVGLRKLLGFWKSDEAGLFQFANFESLNLYSPSFQRDNNLFSLRVKTYNYTLTPERNDSWTLFLVDAASVNIGKIFFEKDKIRLELLDPIHGNTDKTLILSPVALDSFHR